MNEKRGWLFDAVLLAIICVFVLAAMRMAMADAVSAAPPDRLLSPAEVEAIHQDTLLSARQKRQLIGFQIARLENSRDEIDVALQHAWKLWNYEDAQVRHDSIAELPPDGVPPDPPAPDSTSIHPDSSEIEIGGTVRLWHFKWFTHPELGVIPTVCGTRTDTGAQGYVQVEVGPGGAVSVDSAFLEAPCEDVQWHNDNPDIVDLEGDTVGPAPPARDTVPASMVINDITIAVGDSILMPIQLFTADSMELPLPSWGSFLLDPRPSRNDVVVVSPDGWVKGVRPGMTVKMCASLLGTPVFKCASATVPDPAGAGAGAAVPASAPGRRATPD